MVIIARSELERMAQIILDEETGMTALDLWEWQHSYDDVEVIEDMQPSFSFHFHFEKSSATPKNF